jgi:DNA repair exonuclease SbcCD ATPase subunit
MQTPILERLEKTRTQLKTWSTEALEELQSRQKDLTQKRDDVLRQGSEAWDTGLGTVFGAEAVVLETARDLITRARGNFGERADFLKRGEEALTEALVALRAGHRATLPLEAFDSLTVKVIATQLDGLDYHDLRTLRAYEAANKGRKTLLADLDKRITLAAPAPSSPPLAEA